jgi:hypothetical protein
VPRVPNADETRNRLSHHVVGNKTDAATAVAATTKSLMAYLKGLLAATSAGTADIDISAAVYTDYITLLTITPASGECILDLAIDLDYNKATTGFDTVATAGDTLDVAVLGKADGTNWRTLMNGTQITANGDGSLTDAESGERFNVGPVAAAGAVVVRVKLSAERADAEIPYRVTYRGAAPTITPVAAG